MRQSLSGLLGVGGSDQLSFPYGFKHGTIMAITAEEYERIRSFYP